MSDPHKPVIFLTFANDHNGHFLESLRPELSEIKNHLTDFQNSGGIVHNSDFSDPDKILKDLNKFTGQIMIFHYSGHANSEGLNLESINGLPLVFNGMNLTECLCGEARDNLKLVFLNACSTKGLLGPLKKIKVPAVIVTENSISDSQAKSFAVAFYRSFVSGNTLGLAFNQAKSVLEPQNGKKRDYSIRGMVRECGITHEPIPWGLYYKNKKILDWRIMKKKNLPAKLDQNQSHNSLMNNDKPYEIELTINRDYDTFSLNDQKKLLKAIETFLEMEEGDLRINKKSKGSIKLEFDLPPEKAEKLSKYIQNGGLNEFSVSGIKNQSLQEFKRKIEEAVNLNFLEPEFNANKLAGELRLSRVQLYRKTKAAQLASPAMLIRNRRLEKAHKLLESGKYSVTAACFDSGFTHLSYFCRCFRLRYGFNPSEVTRKNMD